MKLSKGFKSTVQSMMHENILITNVSNNYSIFDSLNQFARNGIRKV